MTYDEKWALVKRYYEEAYDIRFPGRLAESKVNWLYENMVRLQASLEAYHEAGRPHLLKLINHPSSR